jgi:hypothetical protein
MDILATIKREERKLEKQLGKLQHQLSGVQPKSGVNFVIFVQICP